MPLFHPFIFAVYPIVFLYALNIRETPPSDIILPVILALILCLLFLLIIKLLFKDTHKSGLLTSVFLILFFSYGHLFDFLRTTALNQIIQGRHIFIYSLYILIFIFALYKIWRSKEPPFHLTKVLNIASGILILMPLFMIASFFIKNSFVRLPVREIGSGEKFDKSKVKNKENLPDIYNIILDRYAREDTIKRIFNYDNNNFLLSLKKQGFYIADDSLANYVDTTHSLVSSLNMTHLTSLGTLGEQNYTDGKLLNDKETNNEVLRILKSLGYKTIQLGSWWEQTRVNRYADVSINIDKTPGFHYLVLSKTIIHPLRVMAGLVPDFLHEQWEREQLNFKKLKEIARETGPKFVFAHFLITHEPYTFRADGSFLDEKSQEDMTNAEKYQNGLNYTNKEILKFISFVLQNKDNYNPIIILQADEGPYPDRLNRDRWNFDWNKAEKEEIAEKMEILNTYFLPNGGDKLLYPSISPVNTFRVIFNYYFGQNFQLLEDNSFLSNMSQPYVFIPMKKQK